MTTAVKANIHGSRWQSLSIHSAAFVSGFVTMALQMLLGRTFIPYFGGTIYTWGALISVFLIGMTAGFFIGGKFADKRPSPRMLAGFFLLSAVLVLAVPLYGEAAINMILDEIDDARYGAIAASLMFACIPAGLLAAVSPFCVRLLLDRKDHSGTISGRLSGLSTAGSIIGTLGTSFFLIPTLGTKAIFGGLAGLSAAVGALFLFQRTMSDRPAGHGHAALMLIATSVLTSSLLFTSRPVAADTAALLMRKDGQLEKVESEYNTIFVEKRGSLIAMAFGYRQNRYTESIIDLMHPADLPVTYTRYMTNALLYHPGTVKRIALVGLGGGRTINYLVNSMPEVQADVAELDPAVIKLAKDYFGVESTDRLHIHAKDGRVFLMRSKERYDVVLLDAYRGPFVPFHLTTQEFYQLVKARLAPGGVVAQNVEPTTMFFDSAYKTMQSVFDNIDAYQAGGNIVLIGYSGAKLSAEELQRRAAGADDTLKPKYSFRELIAARQGDFKIDSDAKLLTDDFAPVEVLKTVERHNEKWQ